MDIVNRQSIRQEFDRKTEYAELNSLLRQKQQVDMQIADLQQQMAALKRKSADLDARFHEQVIACRPTEICKVGQQARPARSAPAPAKTKKKTNAELVLEALKKDPSLAAKLNLDDLDI